MNDTQASEWIRGLELWYNHSDYLSAMQCFDAVLEREDMEHLDLDLFEEFLNNSSFSSPLEQNLAPLLVFMAGCHLDAQSEQKARRYLLRASRYSNTRILAIQEWVASYEEDAYSKADNQYELRMARRMVEWSIGQDSSHWKNAYQRPGYLYPFSRALPQTHYDKNDRPAWCSDLEDNFLQIQSEFYSLCGAKNETPTHWSSVGAGDHREGAGQHDSKVVDGDWREVVLFGSGESNTRVSAPFTCALIQRHIPDAVSLARAGGGEVIFSVLAPKTRIRAHCGTTNLRLTAHLGLSIPVDEGKCAIRVAGEWYNWQEGRVLVFDDSFEHEVVNDTDSNRAVLLLRFWHPDLQLELRQEALSQALRHKTDDIHRRYNPPTGPACVPYVERVGARGLEHSSCPRCYQTGYGSIRVLNHRDNDVEFVCSCGVPIH